MRTLRFAAWTIFLLDLVVLAQLVYGLAGERGDAAEVPVVRGLAVMLASALLGIAIVLVVSARLRLRAGFWVAVICGAVPLLWVISAFFQTVAD